MKNLLLCLSLISLCFANVYAQGIVISEKELKTCTASINKDELKVSLKLPGIEDVKVYTIDVGGNYLLINQPIKDYRKIIIPTSMLKMRATPFSLLY